jgi:DNA-directed RNA polymerase specialized sigma24 family protein
MNVTGATQWLKDMIQLLEGKKACMPCSDEELALALVRFTSSSAEMIEYGFRVLDVEARRFLPRYIALIIQPRARDDVLQATLIKFYQSQRRFQAQGIPQWKKFMRQIAYTCCLDWIKDNPEEFGFDKLDFGVWSHYDEGRDFLDKLAGEAWFAYDQDLPLRERNQRVLAVQLRWENPNLSDEQICEWVNGRVATTTDREELHRTLRDIAVLRDAAYRALYLNGHRLVQLILNLQELPDLFEIAFESISADADDIGLGGWKNCEVAAIVWRYGFGLLKNSILSRPDNSLSKEEFDELCERCDESMPFDNYMALLVSTLGILSEAVFAKQEVFKRLAFEYCYRDLLHQKDILVRMVGAASQVGYTLTDKTLNMWLSGGRLFEDLRDEGAKN